MYITKSVAIAILAFAPSVVFGQIAGQTTDQTTGQTTGQTTTDQTATGQTATGQTTTDQTSTGATGSSNGQNIVQLGANGNLLFTPNMMTVNQGDNVTFAFMTAAHAVMSTSLDQPNVADNQIYSGIIPVDNTTPTPTGKKLPKQRLRIRGTGPMGYGYVEEEKRALAALNPRAKGKKTKNSQLNGQTATFTVQMNQAGMQAFVCPAAQHAANGMIMMVNVLPQGMSKEKRQASDAQLQQALQDYLSVGQSTKTVVPTVNPGTGGQLNAAAASIAQGQRKNGKAKKNNRR